MISYTFRTFSTRRQCWSTKIYTMMVNIRYLSTWTSLLPWPLLRTTISYTNDLGRESWWCHQMETFSALLSICAGNSPVSGEFPAQRPVTRSFDVFFDLRLNKRLSKQPWGCWFETPSWSLWRQCNVILEITRNYGIWLPTNTWNLI